MRKNISISESEWTVMKAVWSDPPRTLPEILESLRHTAWSTTTIQTYLARLVKKGVLTTRRQGRGYLYAPAVAEDECRIAQGKEFLQRVYDGSLSQMVSSFVKSGSLSAEELSELRKMIAKQEEESKDAKDR